MIVTAIRRPNQFNDLRCKCTNDMTWCRLYLRARWKAVSVHPRRSYLPGVLECRVKTRMTEIDARPTIDRPDDDPYLWLEDVKGERALEWAASHSAATLARFGGPQFDADAATLRAIFDRPDNIPYVGRRGGLLYNFWKDGDHPRGLWRRTTLDAYRTGTDAWEVLLDVDALAAA